uniref:Uncharacterized protein n=1 Tax=Panagrolaimus sp. PS1159 TaxID=55785 RepID=A0AC35F369_9BILA
MTKIVVREKKLLEEARENYKLLKERFVLLQAENEQLKNGFEKNIEIVREERETLLTEIDEAKDFITNIITQVEFEQEKRDEMFNEFKTTTVADLQNVYQEQLEQLTAELTEFDVLTNQNSAENEKLSKQCTNLMKQLTVLENEGRTRENSMKEKYEMQIAELSRKLRENHKGDEKIGHLNNELQLNRIEMAALKDDIAKLKKDKTIFMEQKEAELRKIRDELFTVTREKMDSEIAKKSCELGIQRERNLRNEISKLEKDKMELYSQIRNKDFTKESEITEATAHMEAQIQSLEKKLTDMMLTVRNLQKEKESLQKFESENQNLKEKLKNECQIFEQKIHEMDYKILQQKRETEEKLRQLEFERDHAEKRANDVITKSKASIYLSQIEKLKEDLQNKDDEIVNIKSHYRSLLSKMKRAVEKVEEKRDF